MAFDVLLDEASETNRVGDRFGGGLQFPVLNLDMNIWIGDDFLVLPLVVTVPSIYEILITTFPFLCPWSTYRCASTICSMG